MRDRLIRFAARLIPHADYKLRSDERFEVTRKRGETSFIYATEVTSYDDKEMVDRS